MSKTFENNAQKALTMASGIKQHLSEVAHLGIKTEGLDKLEAEASKAIDMIKEVDAHDRKMRQEYKEVLISEERHRILKGKFLTLKKFCAHCGKEFTGYKQTTMFCSSACAKRYNLNSHA